MNELEKFEQLVSMYNVICGVIKEEDIQRIIEFHNIKLSKKEIEKVLSKSFKYVNGYYTEEEKLINDEFLHIRHNLPIRLINDVEFISYGINMLNLANSLTKILNSDELAQRIISFEMMSKSFSEELDQKSINELLDNFNITEDDYYNIKELFEEEGYKLRYWIFYGRTLNEYEIDCLFNEIVLKEKPKNNTLKECLNLLEDDIKEMIYSYYNINDKKDEKRIIKTIINTFKMQSVFFTKEMYDALINQEFSYYLSEDEYLYGFVFAYLDNEVKKIIVPKEIQEALKLIDREDLDSEEDLELDDMLEGFDYKLTSEDYVMDYLSMNGIIEKDKLKEIILKNHNTDISQEEIEEITKKYDVCTIEDKYYTLIDEKKDALQLLSFKNINDDYKVLTPDIHYLEEEFSDEIDFFVIDNWKDENLQEVLSTFIWYTCKFGVFNKESLDIFKDEYNLNNKDLRKIDEFAKKYKNIIAIWPLNGYTLNEKKQVKKEKIGRNDPCPCGSGKKYKQCHGK